MMTFKQFARLKRIEAGLTQQQCANALGLKNRSAFLKLESSHYLNQWSLRYLENFASVLNLKTSQLIRQYELENTDIPF